MRKTTPDHGLTVSGLFRSLNEKIKKELIFCRANWYLFMEMLKVELGGSLCSIHTEFGEET